MAQAYKRLKGSDTSLAVIENGQLNEAIALGGTKDWEYTIKMELKEEGYIGESTNRFDEVFNGVGGSMTLHLNNTDFLRLQRALSLRAQNREVNVQYNLTVTVNPPGQALKRITFADCYFGEIPVSSSGKNEYLTLKLNWACSTFRVAG